jgi:hypothetical protein
MDGVMARIRELLSEGKSSREIIDLGFAPRTVYKVQQTFLRKNSAMDRVRIRPEGPEKLMTPGHSPCWEQLAGLSDHVRKLSQEIEVLRDELSRTQQEKEELELELGQLRPLRVWSGIPCYECGDSLLGDVAPETAQILLKHLAHKACIQIREDKRLLKWGFVGPQLYEAQ